MMHVKTSLALAASLAGLLAAPALAQETRPQEKVKAQPAMKLTPGKAPTQDQEKLLAQRTEKLAKPVFKQAAWQLDYDAARAQAKKENKLLLVYFTRSYAP